MHNAISTFGHLHAGFVPKAHTHWPIFRGFVAESAVESTDSIPEWADYTTDFVILCRLPLSNMFDILKPLESAEGS